MASVEERAAELADSLSDVRTLALYEYLRMRLVRPVNIASPAAGSEVSVTPPAGAIWEVLAFSTFFTASAVAGNRVVTVQGADAAGAIAWRIPSSRTQTTGQGFRYSFVNGAGASLGNSVNVEMLPTPGPVIGQGATFATSTVGIDIGDTYTLSVLTVREWSVGQVYWLADLVGRELDHEILTMLPATG